LSKKLFVFDCDGVLTDSKSSWLLLHEYFGSKDNTYFADLYRRGLISYLDWMKIDIALMIQSRGGPIKREEVEKALSTVNIKPSAKLVVDEIKRRGHYVAVVSSGVDMLVARVCRELGIDICLYNELLFAGDELIPGGVDRVPLLKKREIIANLAKSLGIGLENTVYVGDSEWDIEVFKAVGVSIAVWPCGEACKHAKYVIRDLEELLNLDII